ncbi:peroxiredoxin family protein [Dysgonomonas termitidis]|uniref:Peroxiredoxin family protein n=1 Tax=Dysgonomonas termitidis TaxID=1516126 RepID=A0ABV9KVJ0_9BACT
MSKRRFFHYLIYFIPLIANAQKISILLPQQANKEYVFVLSKGIQQDTIQKGILPFTGDVIINIPEREKDYAGMGSLQIKDARAFNMIVNHEDFSVTQAADQKYIFKDSRENEYLYSVIQEGARPPKDTTLYASSFIELVRYMQQLNKLTSQGGSLMEKANARLFALNQLDMDKLYTSGIWYNVVDGLVKLTADQQLMAEDMFRLMKRINSQEIFEHFANNLIVITEQYGWDDAFGIIVPYIEESGRIAIPQGRLFDAFALAKVRKGTLAPDLDGLTPLLGESGYRRTLLVFYQPDCENCHVQIDRLISDYPKLKEQNVRIVSISSDTSKDTFAGDVKRFPWSDSDKLCDYKGFAGGNFVKYGIMGTPAFFLLDEKGLVIKRYALVTDIDFSTNVKEEK